MAHASVLGSQLPEYVRLEVVVCAGAVGTPFYREQRGAQTGERRWVLGDGEADRGRVAEAGHVGASRFDGCEKEILRGVVDDADGRLAVNGEAKGDAEVGQLMDEVGSS